jgi:thiaminase (transcriptional activator TenA)
MVSGEENTYFLRAFEALGVTEVRRTADPDTRPTAGMREAAETGTPAFSCRVVLDLLHGI